MTMRANDARSALAIFRRSPSERWTSTSMLSRACVNQRETVEWQDETHGGTDDETPVTREESELRESLNEYVRGVVEGLPEPHRTALVLTEYEGLSQVELAARLGLTISAAKSRVQRARAEVRHIVEACCRITTDAYGGVTECEERSEKSCAC